MSVTIKNVAEKCGLPVHVVGRVLNEYATVGPEVQSKILDAARELGYPLSDPANKHLTHNFGVLFVDETYSGLTHPFFATMLNAFKAEVESRGYDITFINHNMGGEIATYLEHCRFRNLDGVCLACVDFYSPEVNELLDSGIPCVTIDHPTDKHPYVYSDNHDGVKQLVDYAVSLGHERIAFISGQRNSQVTDDRIKQFHQTMEEHNLPVREGYFVEGRYGEPDVVRMIVAKMLEMEERPTCILLPDDATYFAAQEVIREHELRIPADISVAGYDGIAATQSLRPQLTTIQQNGVTMGREAGVRLVECLEHPESVSFEPVKIPVTLVKGGTVGWCNEW